MTIFSNDHWYELLRTVISENASDLHLTAGQKPFFRCSGCLSSLDFPVPDISSLNNIISTLLNDEQKHSFENLGELDFAWNFSDRRFRFNLYRQQRKPALAGRLIPAIIPSLTELCCPPVFTNLLAKEHGLILVTGRTGSGKTTTLASFLQAAAAEKPRHIITLEDPIEYLIPAAGSFISQREYRTDFSSFPLALKSALRQRPDIILVGELRDAETIQTAINAAATGHLVLATLHTSSAVETFMRLESFFPAEAQSQIRTQLSLVILASIAQQLMPDKNGGLTAAFEVLTATPAVRNLIRNGKFPQLQSAIIAGKNNGMMSFESSVANLFKAGKISAQTAGLYQGENA